MTRCFIVFIFSQILCFTCCRLFAVEEINYNDIVTVEKCLKTIADDNEFFSRKHPSVSINRFYCSVELLGGIRNNRPETINALIARLEDPIWGLGLPRNHDLCVSTSLIRIGDSDFDQVLEKHVANFEEGQLYSSEIYVYTYMRSLLPSASIDKIVDDFIDRRKISLNQQKIDNLLNYKKVLLTPHPEMRQRDIFPLSDITLNHPLYKARQSTIETNLELAQQILKASKNLISIDGESKVKLLTAIEELGRVRAVEAVEVLTPILLLQSDKEILGLDKKYISLQKYPVGVALAKIGIPSIWGLLEEVAKRSGNADDYRKVACDVMTTILIAKAIPGFVNETLDKHKDNELAQIRLAKLLPLLGEDVTKIELLKPQFRNWQSADNLFEARAKFISLDKKNDVTLEKENGKQTTLELSALSLKDQNYIKEITSTIAKNTQ